MNQVRSKTGGDGSAAVPAPAGHGRWRAALVRATGLFIFWTVLIGLAPVDLLVGLITSAAATWVSLRLLPPGSHGLRLGALPLLALRFVWQSVIAGVDVARRALARRPTLHPGFVSYATRYPRGPERNAFASLTSLTPGSVAVHDDQRGLLYHVIDVNVPAAEQLAEEEAAMARAMPGPTQR
jgi:multicomponent Na+:H+ antiporter subunit E